MEEIKHLQAQLRRHSLGVRRIFEHREIHLIRRRLAECVAALVAVSSRSGQREGRRVKPIRGLIRDGRRNSRERIAGHVYAVVFFLGQADVLAGVHGERQSAVECQQRIHLPAAHQQFGLPSCSGRLRQPRREPDAWLFAGGMERTQSKRSEINRSIHFSIASFFACFPPVLPEAPRCHSFARPCLCKLLDVFVDRDNQFRSAGMKLPGQERVPRHNSPPTRRWPPPSHPRCWPLGCDN